ncbi:MAG: NAD(P)-binding domain-containing protein [Myxococcota bacterium]
MPSLDLAALYLIPLAALWGTYAWRRRRRSRRSARELAASRAAGLIEPSSLHPRIDPDACLGCATCVTACPEKDVLGILHGKARLVKPANCIGHGACREACPTGAIALVLGTETRGIDIPILGSDFQTRAPGIYVAGELGGMGLIRNAIEQGRQAVDAIASRPRPPSGDELDLLIVGAGPAGFSATLAAKHHGLHSVTVEQETLGGTVAHYPRGKLVMTQPAELPLYGRVQLRETSKEELLAFWQQVERETGVAIRYRERLERMERVGPLWHVRTPRALYRARAVLLAIGRRGTPRKLGVPGEEHEKVVYRLVDPEQYAERRVLVVGGGDSALEAAVALAEAGASVVLSYRGEAFTRAKPANRERVAAAAAGPDLEVALESEVVEILPESVRLARPAGEVRIPNDAVLVCAGGILPSAFLRDCGIELETARGKVLRG